MTNTNPNLPAGLQESDLLALVEGEALPRERAAAVSKALAANPACARLVEAMRRDRAAMRAMGEAQAPAGLMDSVEAAVQQVLERQMLVGLGEGESVSDELPVSIVMPRRSPWLAHGSGRRMAIAAGLLLVVGGGVYTAMTLVAPVKPGTTGPLASNPSSAPVAPAPKVENPALPRPEPMLASNTQKPAAPDKINDEPKTTVASAEVIPLDPTKLDSMYGPPEAGPIDAAQAVALAAEHRLIIRVTPPNTRIDQVTDRLANAKKPGWQYGGEATTTLASAVDPESGREIQRPLERPSVPAYASGHDGQGAELNPPIAPRAQPELPKPVGTVYLVNTRLDEASLEGVCNTLREMGADVVFGEAAEPLPIDAAPLAAPAAVVWWGNGPGGWARWGSVPVAIQH